MEGERSAVVGFARFRMDAEPIYREVGVAINAREAWLTCTVQ